MVINDYKPIIDFGKFLSKQDAFSIDFYLKYIFEYLPKRDLKSPCFDSLSSEIKELLSFYLIDGQVKNGGFVQAIDNNYVPHFKYAISGLKRIKDFKRLQLINKAYEIYLDDSYMNKIASVFKLKKSKYELFNELDSKYYILDSDSYSIWKKYIIHNKEKFFRGTNFDDGEIKDGEVVTYYSSGKLYQQFKIENGDLHGKYIEYHENSQVKEEKEFNFGEFTGNKIEYHSNGNKIFG